MSTEIRGAISIKGTVAVSFYKTKPAFEVPKLVEFFKTLTVMYPKKFVITFTEKRGGGNPQIIHITDSIPQLLMVLLEGYTMVTQSTLVTSSDSDMLLGRSFKYTLSCGSPSGKSGFDTILSYLPYDIDGCYTIKAGFNNKIGKKEDMDHYRLESDLCICIQSRTLEDYQGLMSLGYPVYPIRIYYPSLFPRGSDSESDMSGNELEVEESSGGEENTNNKSSNAVDHGSLGSLGGSMSPGHIQRGIKKRSLRVLNLGKAIKKGRANLRNHTYNRGRDEETRKPGGTGAGPSRKNPHEEEGQETGREDPDASP
ncbi:MAG: matrix protein [Betanucleorhabdovirus picridis]|uniref:Matrix protein n=1 Tax=Picris betanucleorhabdovirus 1 TaxID=2950849 RepID=A0AAE9MRM3_9RHAB|nr:MAG: matrix protein [Picris betanucleorhabdovirus 1]